MAKGKIIYREEVEIKGCDGLFIKECRFERKNGLFSLTVPTRVVSKDIVQTDLIYNKQFKELEQKYNEAVEIFESVTYKYETLILYQVEERGSYKDGSGNGFVFNWGVFRKATTESGREKLFFERTFEGSEEINLPYHSEIRREWKELAWTEEREKFFNELSRQIQSIYFKLEYFVNQIDFEKISNIKLIG